MITKHEIEAELALIADVAPHPLASTSITWSSYETLLHLALAGLAAQWRTMDSAPKDGTRVLVYEKLHGIGAAECDGPDGRWFVGGNRAEPTAWQPLPTPPEAER